jgi:hypothetical protein
MAARHNARYAVNVALDLGVLLRRFRVSARVPGGRRRPLRPAPRVKAR